MNNIHIKLLKVVYILLMLQIIWLALFLGKPVETMADFYNTTIPFLITGICGMIVGMIITFIEYENIRSNQ